jgi:hypothetical protein
MVSKRTGQCNRQVPVAGDSDGSNASATLIAEPHHAAKTNPAHRLCVPIFDALTVSGWKGYRGQRRKWLESSCRSM